MFALKAAETRRQWPKRLKMFFNFLTLQGSPAYQSKGFVPKARQNTQWAEHAFIRFIAFQQERVSKGDISSSTILNYYRAAKLFCETNRYHDFLKQLKEDHKTAAQLAKSPLCKFKKYYIR
jgi:hypothetical protein